MSVWFLLHIHKGTIQINICKGQKSASRRHIHEACLVSLVVFFFIFSFSF